MLIIRYESANGSSEIPLKLHAIPLDPKNLKINASFGSMIMSEPMKQDGGHFHRGE